MTSSPPTTGTIRAQRAARWYTGRSELIVAGGVLLLAVVLTIGTITMDVPEGVALPGPQFFPTLVAVFLYIVGISLTIEVLRGSRRPHVDDDPTEMSHEMLEDLGGLDETREIRVVAPEDVIDEQRAENAAGIDWRTVGIVTAALAAFILVMPLAGWLLSSIALFWAISWAFGSKRPLFDIGVAAIFGSIVQLAFAAGLGLTLPAGILEGVFPWIS